MATSGTSPLSGKVNGMKTFGSMNPLKQKGGKKVTRRVGDVKKMGRLRSSVTINVIKFLFTK